jgi:hypothetical protein
MLAFFLGLTANSVTAQTDTATQVASQPETPAQSPYRFLVGPFFGLRTGGTFRAIEQELSLSVNPSAGFGLLFDYRLTRTSRVEFIWSSQRTDFDAISTAPVPDGDTPAPPDDAPQFDIGINYFHGAYVYGGGPPRFQPYVAIGAGVASFCPVGVDAPVSTKFSFSLGTGFRSFVTERIGILFDARAFGTRAGDQREDIQCSVFGCVSFEAASTFWQGHLVGGVVFAF